MLPENNKLILGAYYYLWYGRPTVSLIGGGIWRWGYTNHSNLGEYNSRDEKVISQHINWAKATGIDFFAICSAHIESWDDITLRDYYLKHPQSSELKFCLNYDVIQALNRYQFNIYPSYDFNELYTPTKTKGEKFLEDFEYFTKTYFHLPQYLKIDDKPVVILYNASAFRNVEKYFDKLPPLIFNRRCYLLGRAKSIKKEFSFFMAKSTQRIVKSDFSGIASFISKNL